MEFQWDDGNSDKNFVSHGVTNKEAEEAFYDDKKVMAKDTLHSKTEERFILIGKTTLGRILYIVFTIRNKNMRMISARDINRKEKIFYEKTTHTA